MSGGAQQWGEEGEGLTRTESLPALRVVGFDPSPTSSLKEERNKPSLSSAVSFSPVAVSSPLSALLGNTGKSDRGGESGFFSAESSDSDRGDQARREIESDAMARSILGGGSQEEETLSLHRTDSFATAEPIDIPYRRGHAKHWRRYALREFPSQSWTLFLLAGARATGGTSAREFFARASLRLRARVQMLFDPRRRPPVGRRLRPSTPKRPPRPTPTRGATTTNHRSVSLTTNAIPTPISAPLFAPQTTAAATRGGVLTHPPRSRILATFVDMYDYHNSLFFPPFARAAIARATLRRRGLRPTLASARIWAKHHHTFHSCLVPLEPITTTCKTALKHRERVIRTPRDGDDRTSVSARFAALFGGDTRARRRRRRTASLGTYRRVYQYHSDEMTPTDYAHRTLARSRLALARSNASHPFERSNN